MEKTEYKPDSEKVFKNPMVTYFVPPVVGAFMEWGQTFIIFVFIAALFVSIAFVYIYVNVSDYQNRISVISNATVFGMNPQESFQKFIKSTQAETLAAAMNNIQSTAEEINTNAYRLDDKSQRLSKQISMDVTNGTGQKVADLGASISAKIGGILDSIQKGLGSLTLSNAMQNGAVKTTQAL
jgi:hypothetical protein